jgi:hypothetical protein
LSLVYMLLAFQNKFFEWFFSSNCFSILIIGGVHCIKTPLSCLATAKSHSGGPPPSGFVRREKNI